MIKEVFPSESPATYFVPYVPATDITPRISAKGKLIDRYSHFRDLLTTSGVSKKKQGSKARIIDKNCVVRFGSSDILSEGKHCLNKLFFHQLQLAK